jgi:hypothetical protein
MAHKIWPRRRRLTVGGLDVWGDAAHWVVLSGSALVADQVVCAESLALPEGCVVNGQLAQPQALVTWFKNGLMARDLHLDALYVAVSDADVMRGTLRLPIDLQSEDVAFQMAAELQAAPDAPALCWDYTEDGNDLGIDVMETLPDGSADRDQQTYAWATAPRARVEAWQQFALAAGLRLSAVVPRDDALVRTQHSPRMAHLPPAFAEVALHHDAALGLALGAWNTTGFNFLPHRILKLQALRLHWLQRMAASALWGVFLAVGATAWISHMTDSLRQETGDIAAAEQLLKQVQRVQKEDQTALADAQALGQWLRGQAVLHQQTLEWSRVLSQSSRGLWLAEVKQQQAHWLLRGEALSAAQAHHLAQQLKGLDIWTQAPEVRHLQLSEPKSAMDHSVWEFRIEGHLKVGV